MIAFSPFDIIKKRAITDLKEVVVSHLQQRIDLAEIGEAVVEWEFQQKRWKDGPTQQQRAHEKWDEQARKAL
ncbi:hypothetical protein Taro_013392 [Colocasia esculenta]|uniref:Uncharacterized protein n=1 Tax=Colocasia esculenta TaxID=4460 RepID=A0A843UM08_COLES|nr:hypothetical protein [Colocasia esculenta]